MVSENWDDVDPAVLQWEDDERFRAVFHSSLIGMCISSPSGHLVRTNDAFNRLLGYEPGGLDGKHFKDVTHPMDQSLSLEQSASVSRGDRREKSWEKRYVHNDGSTVWVRLSVSPIFDGTGELLYKVVQVDDISRQKASETAAEISEQRFRQVFDSAASGMALVNPANGAFLRVNAAGCDMLGYSEAELEELTIADVTAPSDREESLNRFRAVITGEVPQSNAKLHYLRKDGSTAYAIVSTALVRDAEGAPLHLVANVVDVTEQVEAQDQLEQLLASKDQLIASVSHELRTPLTAVLGFAELLRSGPDLEPNERLEAIEKIATQTSDLSEIVEDLLVAARVNNDSILVARKEVALTPQAEIVVEAMMQTSPDRPVLISGAPAVAWGDPARVRQILRNLVSNALRHGGDRIELRTGVEGEFAFAEVLDDGPGVPEDHLDRIFEPYQRGPNREGVTASIGLGLTVSRKLAELMDGTLSYRRDDERAVFTMRLPAVAGSASST